jgi:hypothetical protein
VASLIQEFPQVPKTTLYDWAKAERERNTQNPDSGNSPPPPSSTSPDYSTSLDFVFAIGVLRQIATDDSVPQAVRVQACCGLLRAAEMKQKSPAIAMDSQQRVAVDITIQREQLKDLTGAELRQRYLVALEDGDT